MANSKNRALKFKINKPPFTERIFSSYKPLGIIFRILVNSVIGLAVLHILTIFIWKFKQDLKFDPQVIEVSRYLRAILYFNLLSESQVLADYVLEKIFPVPRNIKFRILTQTILSFLFVLLFSFVVTYIENRRNVVPKIIIFLGLSSGFVFITLLSTSLMLIRITQKWIYSQKQLDVLKQQKLQMDYKSLQDQLNPHFLFNNLSVLKSLIVYDKDTAIKFTENFTDVYRYVLQSRNKKLISFKEELQFIEAYVGLHKERLSDGLNIKFSIDKEAQSSKLPPLTLQLLVENAIKHNITSKSSPLNICIEANKEYVEVRNNLQLKEASYSTKTGLQNLMKRYVLLTHKEVWVYNSATEFTVRVPFL